MREVDQNQWRVNYLWRLKNLTNEELKSFKTKNLEPEHKEREVQRITLKKYIEFIGTEPGQNYLTAQQHQPKLGGMV